MAESIADFAPAAARVISCGAVPPDLQIQFRAACEALTGCLLLGGALEDISATAAFKIGAACSLVLGPGAAMLELALTRTRSEASADMSTVLLGICLAHLQAVGPAVGGALPCNQTKAAAAFANSTGKPATLLPWLRAVSQTLLLLAQSAPNCHGGK